MAAVELVIRQPGQADRTIRLSEGLTRLGRADDVDVVLPDVGVSRKHAQIAVTGSDVRIVDLGSGNGTYVRGDRVDRARLKDGDEIHIDPFRITVRIRASRAADRTPAVAVKARLDVIQGPGLAHTTYPIPARGLTMGRSDTRDVVIPDPASSRHHCTIFLEKSRHVMRDMGSANGVFVNGVRSEEASLTSGDVITIGNTEFRYVFEDTTRQSTSSAYRVPADRSPVQPPGARAAPRRADATTIMSVLATIVFGTAIAVVGFLVVLFVKGDPVPSPLTAPSSTPSWSIEVNEDAIGTDPVALLRSGVALVKANDHSAALERFYMLLRLQPSSEAAERFAYATGEHLVLSDVRSELYREAEARETREAERTRLLERAPRDRSARRALERDWAEDPVVREAMSWPVSPVEAELQTRLGDASDAASRGDWQEAAGLYAEVMAATSLPVVQKTARTGYLLSEKELARNAHDTWAAAVMLEASGDTAAAIEQYRAVLEIDPNNASARIRLARLTP